MTTKTKPTIDFRHIFMTLAKRARATPEIIVATSLVDINREEIRKGNGTDVVYLAKEDRSLGFLSSVAAFEFQGGEFTNMSYGINDTYFRDHYIFMRQAKNETLGRLADLALGLNPVNGWRTQNYQRIITREDITDIFAHHGWKSE